MWPQKGTKSTKIKILKTQKTKGGEEND